MNETDRELLELAAKAAGIEYDFICPTGVHCGDASTMRDYFWNPLTSDGDALRLAVKLDILWRDIWDFEPGEYNQDPYAATRRAIVRAAADIGKER
jgi:hypothetical protein